MALLLFNKPFGVICQFSGDGEKPTLANFIRVPDVYPAGRLDTDSEGLLLLTDDGILQARVSDPRSKMAKSYWVQVEGVLDAEALDTLSKSIDLGDFVTRPAQVKRIPEPPDLWPRNPPVRYRAAIPTSWLEITITEGKNRQVRRMTAHVGHPTLRLIRHRIGNFTLEDTAPGQWRAVDGSAIKRRAEGEVQVPRSEPRPAYRATSRPVTGPASRTVTGAASRPAAGAASRSPTGSAARPPAGAASRSSAGAKGKPASSPTTRTGVKSPSKTPAKFTSKGAGRSASAASKGAGKFAPKATGKFTPKPPSKPSAKRSPLRAPTKSPLRAPAKFEALPEAPPPGKRSPARSTGASARTARTAGRTDNPQRHRRKP